VQTWIWNVSPISFTEKTDILKSHPAGYHPVFNPGYPEIAPTDDYLTFHKRPSGLEGPILLFIPLQDHRTSE
jgi:hypothetical protein